MVMMQSKLFVRIILFNACSFNEYSRHKQGCVSSSVLLEGQLWPLIQAHHTHDQLKGNNNHVSLIQ